jgi:hypothetical protein
MKRASIILFFIFLFAASSYAAITKTTGNLSYGLLSDGFPTGIVDGWIHRFTDTGSLYTRASGTWHSVAGTGGGQVNSVQPGTNVSVDNTDPANPIVSVPNIGRVDIIVPGANITVDSTDPANPIVSAPSQTNGLVTLATFSELYNRTTGTNKGDQDLSGLATQMSLTTHTSATGTNVHGLGEMSTENKYQWNYHHAGFAQDNLLIVSGLTITVPANVASFWTDVTRSSLVTVPVPTYTTTLTAGQDNHVIATYSGGVASFSITASDTSDYITKLIYAESYVQSGSTNAHLQVHPMYGNGEIERLHQRNSEVQIYGRVPGSLESVVISSPSNSISISGGTVWADTERYAISAVTDATRMFTCQHDTGGNWVCPSKVGPVLDTNIIDSPTGTVVMAAGSYKKTYLLRGIENADHMYVTYGTTTYASSALAQADNSIPSMADLELSHTMLVAVVTSLQGATSGHIVESAFKLTTAGITPVTNHSSLTQLDYASAGHTGFVSASSLAPSIASAISSSQVAGDWRSGSQVNSAITNSIGTHAGQTTGVHGAGANSFIYSNDSRLTDARTPTAHNQAESTITFTDIATGNSSTISHGYLQKFPFPATGAFFRDDGTWQAIAGGGDMLKSNNLSDVLNVVTARNNILPSKTGNALEVLRVNAGETDYELVPFPQSGNVVGPASATSGAIAIYSNTTGTLITQMTGTGLPIVQNTVASYLTGTGLVRVDNGIPSVEIRALTVSAATQTFTSTTAASSDTHYFSALANKFYSFDCSFVMTAGTTTSGPRFAIAAPASTTLTAQTHKPSSATAITHAAIPGQWASTCTNCDATMTTAMTTTNMYQLSGIAQPISSGTLSIYVGATVNATNQAVKPGSMCLWRKLN